MIDRDLLKRIRKCLALSASSNEHEAAAALAKARDLMAEHGISDADLAMADIGEAAGRGSRAQRPPLWESYLCASVRRALAVECLIDENGDRRFIGRGPTPDIAAYAFASLYRRLKAARTAYIKISLRRCTLARKRIRADAYCEGWAAAVFGKISALSPKAPADGAVTAYIARQFPNLVTIKGRDAAAGKTRTHGDHDRGWMAGRNVDLNHGVAGAGQTKALVHG